MIELSTTDTFDRLFQKLPRKIQLKAAKKTALFKKNRMKNPVASPKMFGY
jgi:hypothetical protein